MRREFNKLEELRRATETAWNNLELGILKYLTESMPDRIFELVSHHGGPDKY